MQVDRPAWPSETSEWALTVVGGPSAGTRLAVGRAETVLGREAVGAALFRGDPAVSRRHAVLCVIDGTWLVEDHDSTNGTFVNDAPIEGPTVLGPEDELRIGATRLRLAPALTDTALLAGVTAPEQEADLWDEAAGAPTAPQPAGVAEASSTDGRRAHNSGKLALSILAAIAGTVLASMLNGSPQLRLAAAALGSAVPAFMTEPGRHQRARVTAAVVLMVGALFLTYGGATVFSYATDHAPIYPVPPVVPPPTPKTTPTPTPTGTASWPGSPISNGPASPGPTGPASLAPTGPASPSPTWSASPSPTGPASPSPTGPGSPAANGPVSPSPSFAGMSDTPPPSTPPATPAGP